MRILLIDDSLIIAQGLASFLEGTGCQLVAHATGVHSAESYLTQSRFNLVITEVVVGNQNIVEFIASRPELLSNTPFLFLTYFGNQAILAKAYQSGALGLLDKNIKKNELLGFIKQAANGERIWDSNIEKRVASALNSIADFGYPESLTKREIEVLQEVSSGQTNHEVAKTLNISYETVKEHVQHILKKLSVNDRTQASLWAVRNKIV